MSDYKLGLISVSSRDKSPKEILLAMNWAGLSYIDCCSYGTYFKFGITSSIYTFLTGRKKMSLA